LEHHDLSAWLFGSIFCKWSLFIGDNFRINFKTATDNVIQKG
jgi:hypothetical protein